jgi:uncharacterized protein (DUF1778 family)
MSFPSTQTIRGVAPGRRAAVGLIFASISAPALPPGKDCLTGFQHERTLYVRKEPSVQTEGRYMPTKAARKKRSRRFNVRASDREARLIRLGAEHRGVNITNFILESACVRAEQEIADTRSFKLSAKDWQKFSEALDRPAQLKPRLKRLFSESTILEQS